MIINDLKSYEVPTLETVDMCDTVENLILCASGGSQIVDMSVCESKGNDDFEF